MPVNSDKPMLWAGDTQASVRMYNEWFIRFAPDTYRTVRARAVRDVLETFQLTNDLRLTDAEALRRNPKILPVLRMCTSPPIAVDRLAGLAGVSRGIVATLEDGGLPNRMRASDLTAALGAIAGVAATMLDKDIFPWLDGDDPPTEHERARSAAVVADRFTLSIANPVIRNAQEERQLDIAIEWLEARGYVDERPRPGATLITMQAGTFAVRMPVVAGPVGEEVNIPVDLIVQPRVLRPSGMPILIEAKSAGDFANVNKRRKEEADKLRHLQQRYGPTVEYVLLLGGYFDRAYLEYEARAGIDWVWEHRIGDLAGFGL